MVKTCKVCGHKHFSDGEYCSIRCELSDSSQDKKPKNSPRWVICEQCGEKFFRGNKKQMFCSRSCAWVKKKESNSIHSVETKCPECGKIYVIEVSAHRRNIRGRFCEECQIKIGRKTTRIYTTANSDEEHTDIVMTQTEIAEIIGITPQMVSMYEMMALKKFKKNFEKMYPDTTGLIRMDSERYGKVKNSFRALI